MSEELKIDGEEVKQAEPSPAESKALEQGWKPKEDWVADGGDPDEWRSAREFVDRGELLKQIHNQNRKVKQIEQSFGALKTHHSAVYEKAYKDATTALKAERRAAMVDGDIERVEMIEDRIEETREEFQKTQAQLQAEAQANQPNAQFTEWVERNSWYEKNEDLREFADVLGIAYARKNPGISPDKVLDHVEKELKSKYPEETGARRAAHNPVSRVDKSNSKKPNNDNGFEMSEQETSIMKNLVRSGTMTKEQYIAELKKVRN